MTNNSMDSMKNTQIILYQDIFFFKFIAKSPSFETKKKLHDTENINILMAVLPLQDTKRKLSTAD